VDFAVALTSSSPVPVYVNNVFQVLTPTVPVIARSNCGTITVIQETQSLSAVGYTVTVAQSPGAGVAVQADQLSKAMQTLSDIKTGADLSKASIKTADGKTKPLLPSGASADTADAAAKGISQLMAVKDSLAAKVPPPGMNRPAFAVAAKLATDAPSSTPKQAFGMSFGKDGATYHEPTRP
jgi:hypothetical protein